MLVTVQKSDKIMIKTNTVRDINILFNLFNTLLLITSNMFYFPNISKYIFNTIILDMVDNIIWYM